MMKLKFQTISPVILSPRMEKGLYKGIDFKEILKRKDINIVYPFYNYEDRNLLSEKYFSYAKEYYIPASSLKGALLGSKKNEAEDSLRSKILFQDIQVSDSHVRLRNLYKFQYLYQETREKGRNEKQEMIYKTPKFTSFFPGIAIEMLCSNKEFEGKVLLKTPEISEEFFKNKLEESFGITKRKLENYIKEIENRVKDIYLWIKTPENKKCIDKLKEMKSYIQSQLNSEKNIIFLGGYKGILGSLSQEIRLEENHKIKNGFYIDKDTLLPYGLVEVRYEK